MTTTKTKTKGQIMEGLSGSIASSKIVQRNTVRIKFTDGSEAIRLHNTNVVVKHPNGSITLNSDGWMTPTTKERITTYSPFRISQNNGVWTVCTEAGTYDYYDGVTFDTSGKPLSEQKTDLKAIDSIKKRITKFCQLITKDNLPVPDDGDCWFCLMKTQDGKTMGDSSGNHDHLESHMEEKYLVGSLLVNAMRELGFADNQIRFHYQAGMVSTFRRAVRRYMQKRLIPNIAA